MQQDKTTAFNVFSNSVLSISLPSFITWIIRPYGKLTCNIAIELSVLPRPAMTGV